MITQQNVSFPYKSKNKIMVFGGHDTWRKSIKPLLPNVTFIPKNMLPDAKSIRQKDIIWLQPNCISHSNSSIIFNTARAHNIPIKYFEFASWKQCAIQLAKEDMKTKSN